MDENDDGKFIQQEKRLVASLTDISDLSRVQYNSIGWTSRVYLVDKGRLVFKFPRTDAVKKEYYWERKAYELLKKESLSISVPVLAWQDPDDNYFGYHGIIGNSLDTCVDLLSKNEKDSIGTQLGSFLATFHTFSLEGAPTHSLDDEIQNCHEKYLLGDATYKSHLTQRQLGALYDFVYTQLPEQLSALPSSSCLCHGDLGPWNILIDSSNQVGVIDFGDVGYYDPSIDFAGMQDDTIRNAALKAYGFSDELKSKVHLRRSILPILEIPYYAGKGNEIGLTHALKTLETFLLTL